LLPEELFAEISLPDRFKQLRSSTLLFTGKTGRADMLLSGEIASFS
jgi:hypothetical protein